MTARRVSSARSGTNEWVSQNVPIGHPGSGQRHTRLRQRTLTPAVHKQRAVQQMLTTVVHDRDDRAAPAALQFLVGLDRHVQTLHVALRRQDPHPGHTEHHRRGRAALTTIQIVEAFVVSCLVATDP